MNRQDDTGLTPLICALAKGNVKCVAKLVGAGADVNVADNEGDTPLHEASLRRHNKHNTKCISMLLKAGARLNVSNNNGKNALAAHLTNSETIDEETAMLLYAAGERPCKAVVPDAKIDLPECLRKRKLRSSLQQQCRETIREHLIRLNPTGTFV